LRNFIWPHIFAGGKELTKDVNDEARMMNDETNPDAQMTNAQGDFFVVSILHAAP
jgi:hypothetical protein